MNEEYIGVLTMDFDSGKKQFGISNDWPTMHIANIAMRLHFGCDFEIKERSAFHGLVYELSKVLATKGRA